MSEYELYVPTHLNDGRPIERSRIEGLKKRLTEHFGGVTHFPQENEGLWKVGSHTFRDHIIILRVLSSDSAAAEEFFRQEKNRLKEELEQEDFLIVKREVRTL